MRAKQYLRGLGVGMLVTAMICGISDAIRPKKVMSDAEIKRRARELGMVEETSILIKDPVEDETITIDTVSNGAVKK